MYMKHKTTCKKIQKILLFYCLFPIIGIMTVFTALSCALDNVCFSYIALGCYVACFLIGLTEAMLAISCSGNKKTSENINNKETNENDSLNENAQRNTSTYTEEHFSDSSIPDWNNQRLLNDACIKEFDEFIAKVYPQLPLEEFKAKLVDTSIEEIRKFSNKMQKHLGFDKQIFIIEYGDNLNEKEAGLFRRDNILMCTIKIKNNLLKSQIEAVLAHEMAHAYQSFFGKSNYDDGNEQLSEIFTDALTMYLGFGSFIKNGYYIPKFEKVERLGYIEAGDFFNVYKTFTSRASPINFLKRKNISLKLILMLMKIT